VAFARPQTAQQAVITELRRVIVERELLPDQQLVQEKLAKQFGLSRVPVREALKTLEGEGVITYRPRRGYFITQLDIDELRELYHVRRLLEGLALDKAPLDEEVVATMESEMVQMVEAEATADLLKLAAANRRFHFALLEGSRADRLVRMIHRLWDGSDNYRSLYLASSANRDRIANEHREILDAVRRGDKPEVRRLLDEHRTHALELLSEALST
jgi:DNA-binding GntR family transcriptional regulator